MASEHATTGDAINHAVDKASDGLAQIAHALSSAAPQAWSMVVRATFAQGMAALAIGLICTALLIVEAIIVTKLVKKIEAIELKDRYDDKFGYWVCLLIPAAALGVILCVGAGTNLLSSDTWVRIISPDGYLAQQILSKAL